ncbi:MAG: NADH-quinone oxidoreductase subunit NuoE [Vulcanimicrobiaceae bacterium]
MNERDFAATAARIEPAAMRLIAQFPAGQARSAMLPILHAFQDEEGWVSPEALGQTAQWIGEPRSVVESTASFYTLFFRKPVGRYMLAPCRNLSCRMNGADAVMARFRERLGVGNLETTADGTFSYEEVECLAACDRAPCMQVNLEFVYDLTPEKVDALLDDLRAGRGAIAPLPQTVAPERSWHPSPEPVRRSAGAIDVSHPDDPGGIGDRVGRTTLSRIVRDPALLGDRPTNERLVADGAAVLAESES